MRVKIFQKRQIRMRDFQVHQQRKKHLKKMKDFLENRHNKKLKESYQENKS